MVDSLGERLKIAMKARAMSVAKLASETDISYQGIKKIAADGTKEMTASTCARIAGALRINPEWLRTGDGVMEFSESAPAAPPPSRQVSESQWAMLQDFDMLPDDEKAALRNTLKSKADHVRKIVAEYLGRQGVSSPPATNARVEETFGAPPPPSSEPAVSTYKKITSIPSPPRPHDKKKVR